jgi:hypothetical protein
VAVALSEGAAAAVPAPLVGSSIRAALSVAAGQPAAVTTPAAALMKGVLKAMFLTKLQVAVAAAVALAAAGAGGAAYRAAGGPAAAQAAPADGAKPPNELEALRKENELLRLNLQLVLEKVQAQQAEVRALKGQVAAAASSQWFVAGGHPYPAQMRQWLAMERGQLMLRGGPAAAPGQRTVAGGHLSTMQIMQMRQWLATERLKLVLGSGPAAAPDPAAEAEAALKELRAAKDKEARRRAADALEKALKKLKEQLK